MIVQSLIRYAERLKNDHPGYAKCRKSHQIIRIDKRGRFLSLEECAGSDCLRTIANTNNHSAQFVFHNLSYCLGQTKKYGDRYRALIESAVGTVPSLRPVLLFLDKPEQVKAANIDAAGLDSQTFATFQVDGDPFELQQAPDVEAYWTTKFREHLCGDGLREGQCMICGDVGLLAQLHRKVGQWILITANCDAFRSWRQENVPICISCSDKYSEALEDLIRRCPASDGKQTISRHRFRVGESEVLFWTDLPANDWLEGLAAVQFGADDAKVRELLVAPRSGNTRAAEMDANQFYAIWFSSNHSRIQVRRFHVCALENVKENVARFFRALKMQNVRIPGLNSGLLNALNGKQTSKLFERVTEEMYQTALYGRRISACLPSMLLAKFRVYRFDWESKQNSTRWHIDTLACFMKAWLILEKGIEMTNQLDEGRDAASYLLGRILARADYLQYKNQKAATTLSDRYYWQTLNHPQRGLSNLLAHTQRIARQLRSTAEEAVTDFELLVSRLQNVPERFTTAEKVEFHLGLYHEKTKFLVAAAAKRERETEEKTND